MNFNDVIELIAVTYEKDSINQDVEKETPRTVFCNRRSISQSEFFQAGNIGIRTSHKFILNLWDYNNETLIRYKGDVFHVYRTFETGDYIELYVEVRADG